MSLSGWGVDALAIHSQLQLHMTAAVAAAAVAAGGNVSGDAYAYIACVFVHA